MMKYRGMRLRVVLGEDHYLVRAGVTRLLDGAPGLDLVGRAQTRGELDAVIDVHRPDVVVTDIRMPPGHGDEGIQVAGTLHRRHPRTGVVLLSQYLDPAYALGLFAAGSAGRAYLLKDRIHDGRELVRAIETVHAGGSMVDPQVIAAMMSAQERKHRSVLAELTPREREILTHLAQGKSNGAIAATLYLTKRAVEKHVNAIFAKLGLVDTPDVSRRVIAALMALAETSPGVRSPHVGGASPRLGDVVSPASPTV
jgi:DNA-binding NarL/FixJ family response regulator